MSLLPIPSCQVSSSAASSKTVQRRSHVISDLRTIVSGEDSVIQLQSWPASTSNVFWHALCEENVQAEMGPFTSSLDGGGQQIQEVPFVYVPTIIRKIADIIEHHEQ